MTIHIIWDKLIFLRNGKNLVYVRAFGMCSVSVRRKSQMWYTWQKKGCYRYTAKPYKRCIPVKKSHFFSYTVTYTNIFVVSSIYLYHPYNKKSVITLCIPNQIHLPIKYLTTDIYKNRSDSSGHFKNYFIFLLYTAGICTLWPIIYHSVYWIKILNPIYRFKYQIWKFFWPIYCIFIYMAQISNWVYWIFVI